MLKVMFMFHYQFSQSTNSSEEFIVDVNMNLKYLFGVHFIMNAGINLDGLFRG